MRCFFFFVAMGLLVNGLQAQRIDYPPGFARLLEQCDLVWFEPLDAGYRDTYQNSDNPVMCDLALRSPKEKLEIRLKIIPWLNRDVKTQAPNVIAWRALTDVAVNDDDNLISGIQLSQEEARERFGADMALMYFFKPKPIFSNYPFCRMLALAKADKATVLVFYFFEDENNPALDYRLELIGFNRGKS
jgi:hypothetical protein